jgi:hypothetical protein
MFPHSGKGTGTARKTATYREEGEEENNRVNTTVVHHICV